MINETFKEKLEREIREIDNEIPNIKRIVDVIKGIDDKSSEEFDYFIERRYDKYIAIKNILNS